MTHIRISLIARCSFYMVRRKNDGFISKINKDRNIK